MKQPLADYYDPQKLTKYNYNVYTTRKAIVSFIESSLPFFSGKVLDAGCGNKPYEKMIRSNKKVIEYIGMDLEDSPIYGGVKKDLAWDGSKIPLPDASVETVLATELLEHCYDTKNVLGEISRVIKDNGTLIGTVPFTWPLHETPHDFYRFTPFALEKNLHESGFKKITITQFGGYNKMLAVSLALWLQHHSGGRLKKRLLRMFVLPAIKRLNRKDKPNADLRAENNIFIGLGFIAQK